MPDVSAVVVATVVLPLINVTAAPGNGWGVVQVGGVEPGQATTEPLSIAVTVNDIEIVCPLPTTVAPELSVAVIVMVPEYVPGTRLAADTLTPNPPLVPDDVGSTSHALLADAFHLTGREHVPVSPKVTFCVVEVDCP